LFILAYKEVNEYKNNNVWRQHQLSKLTVSNMQEETYLRPLASWGQSAVMKIVKATIKLSVVCMAAASWEGTRKFFILTYKEVNVVSANF